MRLRGLTFTIGLCWAGTAAAGGLLLPGSGAVSTSRAGASVASVDDGESIGLNPAGIAKAKGTQITLGLAIIDYVLSFQRNGDYDPIPNETTTYAGTRYPVMENNAKPPLGIGPYQPVPVIAVVSDLGERIPGLHAAFGIYAPNAYPFRDFNTVNGKPYFKANSNGSYSFPASFDAAPPPTRYDVVHEEAAIILPSIAVSYRILPNLDVGARYSLGFAQLNSTVAVWGTPGNYDEWIKDDGIFTLKATDNAVQAYGLGAAFRPTDFLEFGANFTGPIDLHAKGTAYTANGPHVSIGGQPAEVDPASDPRCAAGGTAAALKGCVDVELPMLLTVGGRYKFLDDKGAEKGDVELDVDWENWGKTCDYTKDPTCLNPSDFHVVVDAQVAEVANPNNFIPLKDSIVGHGLQNTYGVRLGGSWDFPMADGDAVIARGGVSYDTAAALPGWERIDLDGAARTMISGGASYKMSRLKFDAGVSVVLEGTRTSSRNCNPTGPPGPSGCAPDGSTEPVPGYGGTGPSRQGPDPISPIVPPGSQLESPVNEGTFKSHYLIFMLGASYWF